MDSVSDCGEMDGVLAYIRFSKKRVWKWRFMSSIQGNEICRGIENYGEDG
jgi:hypothetical protein